MMATKLGGDDPDMNPRLRLALQSAKIANMPNDNIKRAIQKGSGGGEGTDLSEVIYEAYASHGVGLLVKTLTDNINRTISNIRAIINKSGGNMAEKGSVSYMYEAKGLFIIENCKDPDFVIDLAIEHEAEDVEKDDANTVDIVCSIADFESLKTVFEQQSIECSTATITMIPSTTVMLSEANALSIIDLIEKLEEDDDVQEVYANLEIEKLNV